MNKSLKSILIKIYIIIHRYTFGLFYDAKYLKGRWFDNNREGWSMVRRSFFTQKIIGINRHIPWVCQGTILVTNPKGIFFDVDDLNIFQGFGKYFQCTKGNIYIGKGTYIAVNVGIITANHNFYNLDEHSEGKDVVIGKQCWLGMNVVILPGVMLGDRTIVGAGSVVTKSFPEGQCVIAGNPARIIRAL
jgi:acetyltransferase-like isoleucine patch superfamily enzyme